MNGPTNNRPDDEFETILVSSFYHRGLKRRLFAWEHNKKAFALRVRRKN